MCACVCVCVCVCVCLSVSVCAFERVYKCLCVRQCLRTCKCVCVRARALEADALTTRPTSMSDGCENVQFLRLHVFVHFPPTV